MHNFMLLALVQSIAASAVLAIFLLPPGFLLGWTSNVLQFRKASGSERLLISVALSIVAVPTIAVLLERFAGIHVALIVFLLAAVATVILLVREWRASVRSLRVGRTTRIGMILMLAWAAIALLSLVDWQIGERLYPSTTMFDHQVRVQFVSTVIRNGVPPLNPFFHIGASPVLRYYYYWYVVAALPGQLAGLPARACFNASIVWAGFGLAALVPLFLKHFAVQSDVRRKSIIGMLLLTVTGLDILVFTIFCSRLHFLISDMEWWDPNQVTSWIGSLLWVPNHVSALIACMVGLLLLFTAEDSEPSRAQPAWTIVLAGTAFASGAGLSVYVTFTFAVFCALWILVLALQKRLSALANWLAAAVLSFLFAAPYLHDLLTGTSGAGSRFAIFSLRDFPAAIDFLAAHGIQNPALLDFAKLPIIALVYIVEFGFFFVVAVLQFRRDALGTQPMQRWQRCAWLLFGSCLFVVTIFKSDVTNGNDLGFRGILPAQFVLLLWATLIAADLLRAESPLGRSTRVLLHTTLWIGVAGTVCQLALLRGFVGYVDSNQKPRAESFLQFPEVGAHAYLIESGLTELRKHISANAIYQADTSSPALSFLHLYAEHSFAAGDPGCGATFGGDPRLCEAAVPAINAPFRVPVKIEDVDEVCNRYDISVMIATDLDSIWQDGSSWVWQREPLVANQAIRALPCGKAAR